MAFNNNTETTSTPGVILYAVLFNSYDPLNRYRRTNNRFLVVLEMHRMNTVSRYQKDTSGNPLKEAVSP